MRDEALREIGVSDQQLKPPDLSCRAPTCKLVTAESNRWLAEDVLEKQRALLLSLERAPKAEILLDPWDLVD